MSKSHDETPVPGELQSLVDDYSHYLCVDASQQIKQFEDGIEDMLTHLDEYHGLLDLIRGETSLCMQKNFPMIAEKYAQMELIFDKIDKLEVFVAIVYQNVKVMEDHVDQAEADLGSFSTIRKVLDAIPLPSFLGLNKSPLPRNSENFAPPVLYKTKDFIKTKTSAGDSETRNPSSNMSAPQSTSANSKSGSPSANSKSGSPSANSEAPSANSGAPSANSGAPLTNSGATLTNSGAPLTNSVAPSEGMDLKDSVVDPSMTRSDSGFQSPEHSSYITDQEHLSELTVPEHSSDITVPEHSS